jgi:hypothetical protein
VLSSVWEYSIVSHSKLSKKPREIMEFVRSFSSKMS